MFGTTDVEIRDYGCRPERSAAEMVLRKYFQTFLVLITLTLFVGGCDERRRDPLKDCQSYLETEKKDHAKDVAELKQQALNRVYRVAQRYTDALEKTKATAKFRSDHSDMPQGTIECRIGAGKNTNTYDQETVSLFPAEVESLRKEQTIYQAMGWMFEESEELQKLKVGPNSEIVLPPELPARAPEPKVEKTSGSQVLTANF